METSRTNTDSTKVQLLRCVDVEMKVKVGDTIYDADNGDGTCNPIMLILSDRDKLNISNMDPSCSKYAMFPDTWTEEQSNEFMELDLAPPEAPLEIETPFPDIVCDLHGPVKTALGHCLICRENLELGYLGRFLRLCGLGWMYK